MQPSSGASQRSGEGEARRGEHATSATPDQTHLTSPTLLQSRSASSSLPPPPAPASLSSPSAAREPSPPQPSPRSDANRSQAHCSLDRIHHTQHEQHGESHSNATETAARGARSANSASDVGRGTWTAIGLPHRLLTGCVFGCSRSHLKIVCSNSWRWGDWPKEAAEEPSVSGTRREAQPSSSSVRSSIQPSCSPRKCTCVCCSHAVQSFAARRAQRRRRMRSARANIRCSHTQRPSRTIEPKLSAKQRHTDNAMRSIDVTPNAHFPSALRCSVSLRSHSTRSM